MLKTVFFFFLLSSHFSEIGCPVHWICNIMLLDYRPSTTFPWDPTPLLSTFFTKHSNMVSEELTISEPTAWVLFSTPGAGRALTGEESMGTRDESRLQLHGRGVWKLVRELVRQSRSPWDPLLPLTQTQSTCRAKPRGPLAIPASTFWLHRLTSFSTKGLIFLGNTMILAGEWSLEVCRCLSPAFISCL